MSGAPVLPDVFYYLNNFKHALHWVAERNRDLLSSVERAFFDQFGALPVSAQALLSRLSMREGVVFRHSKIQYAEIDPLQDALSALIEIGWIDPRPRLTLQTLFGLSTRAELATRFGETMRGLTKYAAYEALIEQHADTHTFQAWLNSEEPVYHVTIAPIVLQFRLLHFGNFWQGWHEYTLTHLQIFKYETVPLDETSRPFESREDIEFFYALYRCHEALGAGAELSDVLDLLPPAPVMHGWLRRRFDRLRYQVGQQAEREDQADTALAMYRDNTEPAARVREVRLLECLKRDAQALDVAQALLNERVSELIEQRVTRIVTRLKRRRGEPCVTQAAPVAWVSTHLTLDFDPDRRVEVLVQDHLASDEAPVHYVENSLLGSLFGLLCWDALFAPVPGAFFHPFQSGPSDLGCAHFVTRRRAVFDACLQSLQTHAYVETILARFVQKHGTSAPFVHWGALDEPTLKLALHCMPAQHLQLYFARMLDDLTENATGLPDLAQFFPASRTYKLIEVKGPGDRAQDNQRRWLQYCARHQLPVEVCQVSWAA